MWQNGKIAKIHTYIRTYIWQHVEQEAATVRYRLCDCECGTMNHLNERKTKKSPLVYLFLSHYWSSQMQMLCVFVLEIFLFWSDILFFSASSFFLFSTSWQDNQVPLIHHHPQPQDLPCSSIFVSCSPSCVCLYVKLVLDLFRSFRLVVVARQRVCLPIHLPTHAQQ